MAEASFEIPDGKIGLTGATALAIGNAIAATTFIVPAELLTTGVGPSMALAALLVVIPTVVLFVFMLQLGGAMPTSGGGYVYNSVLLSPFWGFARPWVSLPAIWFGLPFTAQAFAQYLRFYLPFDVALGSTIAFTIPTIPTELLVGGLIFAFMIINILGIRATALIQYGLVTIIIVASALFVGVGLFHINPGNFTPVFPGEAVDPFVAAVITLFLGMTGFSLPLQLGEEIENPITNIPRSIALSTIIGMTLLTGLIVVAIGVVHWSQWAGAEAGIAVVAREFLPWWGVFLIVAAAIVGGLTTVNAVFVNVSRIVMRAARDGVIPHQLAHINERWGSPDAAILAMGIPALVVVPFAPGLLELAFVLSLSFLMDMVFLALGALQLTRRFPERYDKSTYRVPKALLYPLVAIGVVIPVALWVLLGLGEGSGLIIATAVPVWLGIGYAVYRYRVWRYAQRGIDLPERMRHLHEHEAEMASDFDGAVTADDD